MIIILGFILTPNYEFSLLHSNDQVKTLKLAFYFNDCFGLHNSWKTQYEIFRTNFFPRFFLGSIEIFLLQIVFKNKTNKKFI